MIKEFFYDLKTEFQGYSTSKLVRDIMAGLTVTAVALPLALAFGVSSGVDAASGLITAIIGGLVMSFLAGAYYQISGPTGAMAAILLSVVAKSGLQGMFVATVIAGLILVVAGLFRFGKLITFIPIPVIIGFTSGIAVIIALGQIDNFFGISSHGNTAVARLLSYGALGFSPNWIAVGIGLFVVLFMSFFPKKWSAVVPASLLAIIITTAASILLKIDVNTVGVIPKTLLPENRLILSAESFSNIDNLLGPAFSIAMLGMIESLLCGASAARMTGVRLKSNQELLAQGIGNLLIPFFGGIPATAAIARTSVAIKSGAKTRLTGILHSVGLLLSMFLLAPVMSKIPLSALAGVLMVTAWRMNEWGTINYIFKKRFKGAITKFLITMVATIIFDLVIAIILGVIVALLLMIAQFSKLEIDYEPVDIDRLDIESNDLIKRYSNTMVAYITGSILFANTQEIEDIPEHLDGCDTLLLSMRGVPHMDISGAQVMTDLIKSLHGKNIDVMFCGVSPKVREIMDRSEITEMVGEDSFYWSAAKALKDLRPLMQGA